MISPISTTVNPGKLFSYLKIAKKTFFYPKVKVGQVPILKMFKIQSLIILEIKSDSTISTFVHSVVDSFKTDVLFVFHYYL